MLTHIVWKNHHNGALNPLAQFRKEVSKATINASPVLAGGLNLFDCSGVADGAAAAIICRAEDARPVHGFADLPARSVARVGKRLRNAR